MRQNKTIHTRHYFIAIAVIGAAAWMTHSLTTTLGVDASWNIKAMQKFDLKSDSLSTIDNSFSPISFSEQADSLSVFTPSSVSKAVLRTTIEDTMALESEVISKPKFAHSSAYSVKRGDTLGSIFKKQGFDQRLPYLISKDPVASALVKLSIGKEFRFGLNDKQELRQIIYPISALEEIIVNVDNEGIKSAVQVPLAYEIVQQAKSGVISVSLYETALEQGISIGHIMDMVRIFGWDIDFVLDIRSGDSFHMIYEDYVMDGKKLTDGALLAAEFTTQGNTYRAIRFENDDGEYSYFAPNGESMLGTFLRSPVEFSRVSSKFGQRKHPILKTWRAHRGVDYAASRGTPIRATADGKVDLAGQKGGYGNTVILSHAGRFTTLYAHMTGFAKGIKRGARVQQGQVIGYIGSSGLATGPHLHYEFRLDGVHRNPLTYKTPKATAVKAEKAPQFNQLVSLWSNQLDTLRASIDSAEGIQNLGAD